MSRITFSYDDVMRLENSLQKLSKGAETIVNEVLHGEGVEILTDDVVKLINIGKRGAPHAKTSNPFKADKFNLGFTITTKKAFGHLVFPDEGRGVRNHMEQNFSGKGLLSATPKIVTKLEEIIKRKIEEGLNNA